MRTSRKEKKRLLLISFSIIVLLVALIITVYKDFQLIVSGRKKEIELSKKYEELIEEQERLDAEIVKLQDDKYLARYAKEKFMLSKEGDTIIQMR